MDIVVVDTGSVDTTKEIARKYTSHVYDYAWDNNFSDARNYSISQATQPWILVMDADEVLDHDSLPLLQKYCEKDKGSAGRVKIINLDGNEEVSVAEIVRLIPNNKKMKYTGRIHEQVTLSNGEPPEVISTGIQIFHSGYSKSMIKDQNKIKRNIEILTIESNENPSNAYVWYQLGKTNYVGGNYKEANSQFQQAIDLIVETGDLPPYLPNLLISYVYSMLKMRDFEKIFPVIDICMDLYPDFTDIYFGYGVTLMELKDASQMDNIREAFEYCIKLGEADSSKYETVPGVGTYKAYYNLGVYYEVTGDVSKAIEYYKKAENLNYEPAAKRYSLLQSEV